MPENDDKNVYILGAGFSRQLGLPLQDDFLSMAQTVYWKNPQKYVHFNNVFEYRNGLSRMRNYLSVSLLNLENLFNLLEMNIFFSDEQDNKKVDVKKDFIKMIKDVLFDLTPNPFDNTIDKVLLNQKYDNYRKFLNMFIKNKNGELYDDTIISFNYDLVFEATVCAFNWYNQDKKEAISPISRGQAKVGLNILFEKPNIKINNLSQFFYQRESEKYEDCFSTHGLMQELNRINLIKLHGSINWEEENRPGEIFLVPPTWNKSNPEIRKLWETAYQELSNAKRIIIIGYSFPQTDSYVESLLALAVNENKKLQNIFFINPDSGTVKERCMDFIDKHFEKHCGYKEWTFAEFIKNHQFIQEGLARSTEPHTNKV